LGRSRSLADASRVGVYIREVANFEERKPIVRTGDRLE